MSFKSSRSLLLVVALGFLILWIMEIRRVGFGDSYWLLLLGLSCVLVYQYMRLRTTTAAPSRRPAKGTVSSTKRKKK